MVSESRAIALKRQNFTSNMMNQRIVCGMAETIRAQTDISALQKCPMTWQRWNIAFGLLEIRVDGSPTRHVWAVLILKSVVMLSSAPFTFENRKGNLEMLTCMNIWAPSLFHFNLPKRREVTEAWGVVLKCVLVLQGGAPPSHVCWFITAVNTSCI